MFSFFCLTSFLRAEAVEYYFKRISIEHGLSHATVNTILRDYHGALWVGTKQGLNRVDRGSIRKYFYPSVDNKSSRAGNIIQLFEGSDHTLWVLTDHGLYSYVPGRDTFVARIERPIHAAENVRGGVLFGGYSAIYRYDSKTQKIIRLPLRKVNMPAEGDYLITFLQLLDQQNVLVGTESNGIYVYSLRDHVLRPLIVKGEMVLNALYWDRERQEIFLSLYQQGLFCYDRSGRLLRHYDTANSALTNNIVLSIKKHRKQLWLGTDGGGISVLNLQTGALRSFRHIPGASHSLPINSIKTLYEDHYGNLWAGTVRDGLFQFKKTYIQTYTDGTLGSNNGLSERVVISLFKSVDGGLWVGTDGGGLNYFNPTTDVFTHHLNTYNDKIVSVTDLSPSALLVSRYGKGLSVYHTKSRTYSPFVIVNGQVDAEECHSGFVPTAYRTSPTTLLILGRNTYSYQTDTHTFEQLRFARGTQPRLSLQMMYTAGGLTLLSKDNCLYRVDSRRCIRLLTALRRDLQITSVCCEKATGKLWIATSGGLYTCTLYHPRKVSRVAVNLFGHISTMQSDDRSRLWINASNMLFSYDTRSGRCMIWDESEGFLPNDILTRDVTPTPSPYIYMGGINGLVKIDKRITDEGQDPITVYLQSVEHNGKLYTAATFPHTILQNFNSLRITINLNENDIFRHVLFRYRIRGERQNSITESYLTDFNIPSLAPGDYTVYVAYMTKNGGWTREKSLVSFRVMPPWYRRTWVVLVSLAMLLCIAALAVWWTIRRNRQRMKWKMALHQQALNEDKIQFLTNISHELRTPLTLIYAPLKRLLSGSAMSVDDAQRAQIESVFRQAGYMKNIINWVLEYDKNTSLGDSLTLAFTDINHLVEEVLADFAQEFKEKRVRTVLQLDSSLRPVEMDRAKIRVVLSNLLMNALKFSREDTDVTIRTFLRDDMLRVQIEDRGAGLKNLDMDRLFTRFYQGRHRKQGSGIGLAYCKELVEKHKGRIGAADNPGGGTIMFFELRYRISPTRGLESQEAAATSVASPLAVRMLDLTAYQVLVVDDNREFLKFLEEELQPLFGRIWKARDGEEALRLLRERQPDIVVSDVMMPAMDGYQLCRNIKEDIEISHIPVILLTAKSDAESQKIGYKLGADAYLSKPFDTELLVSVVETQLRRKELLRQKYQQDPLALSPQAATGSNADERFMIKLNATVKEGYADASFDIARITDALAMSRASLYNKMKQLTGMGVNEYVNKYRVTMACALLEKTDKPIADIAFETGFTSQRYFSTVFKAATGQTPTSYRTRAHES